MSGKMFDEVWAVDARRIEAFFREYGGEAEVLPLPERKIGTIPVPQTRVIITGEDAEEVYRKFFLHFISAGG